MNTLLILFHIYVYIHIHVSIHIHIQDKNPLPSPQINAPNPHQLSLPFKPLNSKKATNHLPHNLSPKPLDHILTLRPTLTKIRKCINFQQPTLAMGINQKIQTKGLKRIWQWLKMNTHFLRRGHKDLTCEVENLGLDLLMQSSVKGERRE
ncbi:hypothetical protein EYC80_010089 [Monilinia laxa]|uniref:Uncharacterized protein n=1 Tax=Monilinia laxa TaxID=61186 RepID=A0A5N6JU81_MONLA|nr:hypothetical protein EYC80_010089 [Monilinia laxa]